MDVRRISFVGLVALSVVCLGCTSKSGNNRLAPTATSSVGQSSATAPLGDARYDNLVSEMRKHGNQGAVDVTPQTTTQKVTGAFKQASASVASALTLKPRVRKAPDPLALDNMPKKIGVDLCYQAGRLAESNGNAAAAIQQYERGLKDEPKHLPTLISLARLYDRQDEFDKAEKLYRRALEAEPDNAMAHNDLGLCLARHDQSEPALAALRKAVNLEPNRKLYRNNLATVLVDLGRIDEAWGELSTAHPAAVAHYNLGYLLYHVGNKPRALEEFMLAKQADASLAAAQQMLDQLAAETPDSGQTQVAMAPRAPAAPKVPAAPKAPTKVKCRVEDLAPQPTSLDKPVQALPVAAVHSPPELRRTPPTDASSGSDLAPSPGAPLTEPVPLAPADIHATPSVAPDMPIVEPPASDFPIRRMSGALIEEAEELDLPTPAVLEDVSPPQSATK